MSAVESVPVARLAGPRGPRPPPLCCPNPGTKPAAPIHVASLFRGLLSASPRLRGDFSLSLRFSAVKSIPFPPPRARRSVHGKGEHRIAELAAVELSVAARADHHVPPALPHVRTRHRMPRRRQ